MRSTNTRLILSALLSLSFLFSACSSDDDNNQEEIDPTAFIQALTDGSSKTWKIESARLTNNNTDDTDGLFVSGTYNLNDDEFFFSSTSGSEVTLYWRQGITFNRDASNEESFLSDVRVSPMQMNFQTGSSDDQLLDPTTSNTLTYQELNNTVRAVFTLGDNSQVEFILTPKLAGDFHSIPSSIDQVAELFSASPAVFAAGFKVSQARDQVYLSNLGWPGDPAERDPFIMRYDLSSQQEVSRTFTDEDDIFMHIELMEEGVVNLGGYNHQLFDYSLEGTQINYTVQDLQFSYGTTAYNNEIYVFGGWVTSPGQDGIVGKVVPGSSQLDILTTLPKPRRDCDGVFVDDRLYIFGGRPADEQTVPGSDDLYVYDLQSGSVDQRTMPVNLTWVRTAVIESYIYVSGLEPIDTDGDGTFDDNRYYLGAYDTASDSWTEIALTAPEFADNIISNIYIAADRLYLVVWKNTPGTGERLSTVYYTEL